MKRKAQRYDPDRAPVPSWWSSLTENEQIAAAEDHHRRAGIKLPRPRIHATTHVIVENQVLLGEETPVAGTFDRLLREGLARHDAVHAIGSVLAPVMVEIMQGEIPGDPNLAYYERLERLTAEGWISEFS
jgi:hypothetical protein